MNLIQFNLTELMDLEALFRARSRDDYRETSYLYQDLADEVLEEIINRVNRKNFK